MSTQVIKNFKRKYQSGGLIRKMLEGGGVTRNQKLNDYIDSVLANEVLNALKRAQAHFDHREYLEDEYDLDAVRGALAFYLQKMNESYNNPLEYSKYNNLYHTVLAYLPEGSRDINKILQQEHGPLSVRRVFGNYEDDYKKLEKWLKRFLHNLFGVKDTDFKGYLTEKEYRELDDWSAPNDLDTVYYEPVYRFYGNAKDSADIIKQFYDNPENLRRTKK